jgi:O-antigen/teichoic acid export membrane protein
VKVSKVLSKLLKHISRTSASSRRTKVLALSLGHALTTAISLATAMILSRVLSKGEYATYRQTLLAFTFVMPFMSLGLTNSVYYFLPTERERPRGLVSDNVVLLLAMGTLFALFVACGGNQLLAQRFNNPDIVRTLLFLIPYPVAVLPAQLLAAVLVTRERVALLSAFNVIKHALLGLGIVLPVLFWSNADAPLIGNVVVTAITGLAAVWLILRLAGAGGPRRPQWDSMRTMVRFGFPLGLASMLGTASLQLGQVIVSAMCTPEHFAVYVNGAVEIPLIGIVTGSMSTVLLADMRRMVAAGDEPAALSLFRRAAERGAMLLLPTMCFLMVAAEPFVTLMFSTRYIQSVLPFRLYLLVLPARIVFWSPILVASGLNRVVLLRSFGHLVFNALLGLVLVPKIGYLGAIVSTLSVTYFWSTMLSMRVVAHRFRVSAFSILPLRSLAWFMLRLLVPTVATGITQHLLLGFNPLVQIVCDMIVFGAIFVMVCPELWRANVLPLFRGLLRARVAWHAR